MIEEALCITGKMPKILSYLDEKEHVYKQITFKLKDTITHHELKDFFNTVYYSMKLDGGYTNNFSAHYNTSDLVMCLKEILRNDDVVSLTGLYQLTNVQNEQVSLPLLLAIQRFFDMFEVIGEQCFSIEEYNELVRQNEINPLFKQSDSIFKKELATIEDNSKLMNYLKTPEAEKYSSRLKVKKIS